MLVGNQEHLLLTLIYPTHSEDVHCQYGVNQT